MSDGLAVFRQRLAALRARSSVAHVAVADTTRSWANVVYDSNKHHRGAGGKFIGGAGMQHEREAADLIKTARTAKASTTYQLRNGEKVHGAAMMRGAASVARQHATNAAAHATHQDIMHLQMVKAHYQRMLHEGGLAARTESRLRSEIRLINTHLSRYEQVTGKQRATTGEMRTYRQTPHGAIVQHAIARQSQEHAEVEYRAEHGMPPIQAWS